MNDNFSITVIIDDLELINVTYKTTLAKDKYRSAITILLHKSEELDGDLGARTDQDLTLSAFLGIVNSI